MKPPYPKPNPTRAEIIDAPTNPLTDHPQAHGNPHKVLFDLHALMSSDAYRTTSPLHRPWFAHLWLQSWLELPCGSWPASDDPYIARAIGMPIEQFRTLRPKLLQDWYLCDDGRLYHPIIMQIVLNIVKRRKKNYSASMRKALGKARIKLPRSTDPDTPPRMALRAQHEKPNQRSHAAVQDGSITIIRSSRIPRIRN